MGYGNLDECLNNSEAQIRKARKKLRKIYTFLCSSCSQLIETEALEPILKVDLDLLEGLNAISEKDRVCADGVKRDPKWVARDRKMFRE